MQALDTSASRELFSQINVTKHVAERSALLFRKLDDIASRRWPQMRLERGSVYNINRPLKEAGYKLFQANVIVNCPFGAGLEFD